MNGLLASIFTPLVGTDPRAGIAVMFVGAAILGCLMALSGYLFATVCNVETGLPDHDVDVDVEWAMVRNV